MIDIKTYQDLLEVGQNEKERMNFVLSAIQEHKQSEDYKFAESAEDYYNGENTDIYKFEKVIYDFQGKAHKDMYSANHKISSSFFGFAVDQEVSYILGNGVTFGNDATKDKLGKDFDIKIKDLLENAEIAGKCFAFWNNDHLEVFPLISHGDVPAFIPLYDEEDGALKAGIRFWQLDETKPLRATLYELDGYTEYIKRKEKDVEIYKDKRPYVLKVKSSKADGDVIYGGQNYPSFPIFPLKYNKRGKSRLCGKKNTVNALDLATSNMINNVDEGNLIYWVLTNCGGMNDLDDRKFLEQLKTSHIVHADGDDGAKAEPHSIEAPYVATKEAIEILNRKLYTDFQCFDVANVTAGNQTATAIRASYVPLDLLADKTEMQVTDFILRLLEFLGIDDKPTYTRNQIINKKEETETILLQSEYFDNEYTTKKLLTINGDSDMYDEMIKRRDAEEVNRFTPTEPIIVEEVIEQ